jgi:acyl-CoA thioesterase-2
MNSYDDFYQLLNPEQTGELTFTGASLPMDSPAIFGGQLMAQALSVAAATLDKPRPAHYLQTNFLAFGDPKAALEFEVQKVRDGRSTSHRQVLLRQGERILLTAVLSFQDSLQGYDHQLPQPELAEPETLLKNPANELDFSSENEGQFPFIILECPSQADSTDPVSAVWAKPRESAPPGQLSQQQLFAFFSDATILQSALQPHNLNWDEPGLTVATMNHTIWFQRDLNIDDWILFHSESPSAKAGRALSVANAFSRSGTLVATVAQEGILRVRPA